MNASSIENTTFLNGLNNASKWNQTLTCHGLKDIKFEITTTVLVTAILTCLINFIFGVFAIISNAVLMITFWIRHHLKTPSNLLLFSMCITDFLVGLIVQMWYVILRINEMFNVHFCVMKQIYAFFGYLCSGASLMTLSLVTLDRWFAISMPYRYKPAEIYNKYKIVTVTVWVVWFSYSVLPWLEIITSKAYFFSLSFVMLTSLAISAACYIRIHSIVRQHEKAMAEQAKLSLSASINLSVPATKIDVSKDDSTGKTKPDSSNERSRRRNREATRRAEQKRSKTVAIIVAVFLVCYLPKVFIMAANLIFGDSPLLLFVGGKWSETLVFLNSSLNPIIYCLRISSIREEVKKTFRLIRAKLCWSNQISPGELN